MITASNVHTITVILALLTAISGAIGLYLERIEKQTDVDKFISLATEGSPSVSNYMPEMYSRNIDPKHLNVLIEYITRTPGTTQHSNQALAMTKLVSHKFPVLSAQSKEFRESDYTRELWMYDDIIPSKEFTETLVRALLNDVVLDPTNKVSFNFLMSFLHRSDSNPLALHFDNDVLSFLSIHEADNLDKIVLLLPEIKESLKLDNEDTSIIDYLLKQLTSS